MIDFLTFKSFISTEVLIVFYYIGAIIMPLGAWYFSIWLLQKYENLNKAYEAVKTTLLNSLSQKQKSWLIVFFIVSFLFMELFWRMFFEYLIAYIQIRDALVQP